MPEANSWDDKQIKTWVSADRKYPQVFLSLIDQVAIVPALMGSSRMDNKISILQRKNTQNPNIPSFGRTASNIISKAYHTNTPRHFYGSDPGGLSDGNFYNGFTTMYSSLREWQKPLFHRAIYEMELNEDDKDDLRVTCGLVLRAAGECQSRKQDVFTKVIDRCVSLEVPSGGGTQRDHISTLYEAARIPVDEMKEVAFKSVFLEPTKMYFRAIGDITMEGDVEVHGSNTYLAVLLATLGVKLPQTPHLEDSSKGVAAFADAIYEDQLKELWDLKNKGKSWELVLGKGMHDYQPVVERLVTRNRFYAHGSNARSIAKNCVRDTNAAEQIKRYLDPFVAHFTMDEAAERLCNYYLYQDDLHECLNAVFIEVVPTNEVNDAGGDVRYWLWNVISGEFCVDRAVTLLQLIGIFKSDNDGKKKKVIHFLLSVGKMWSI